MESFDLIVIGAGPGGMEAATRAAIKKKKVALVNGARIWGHGLHGAYKSKGMYELARAFRIAKKRGWGYIPSPGEVNFAELNQQLLEGTNELEDIYKRQLRKLCIHEFRGMAQFVDDHTVQIGDIRIRGDYIIIATGTNPRIPPNIDVDGVYIMAPDHFTRNTRNLKSLTILGAGIIGCEFASIMNAIGVKVHLIDSKPAILNHEDEDLYTFLNRSFAEEGIIIHHSSSVTEITKTGDNMVRTVLQNGEVIITEAALIATGRTPNTQYLNPQKAGVQTDSYGYIPVNGFTRTNVPHIYAVGDVGQRTEGLDMALVHVAEAEAVCAVDHIFENGKAISLNHIPFIIFTMPMVAGAGMNEKQARKLYPDIRVAKYEYVHNHRAHAMRYYEGYVKLIVGPNGDDRILGMRAIGPMADSIIGEVSLMIELGLPYTKLINMIHAHPSLSESLQSAARMIEGTLQY